MSELSKKITTQDRNSNLELLVRTLIVENQKLRTKWDNMKKLMSQLKKANQELALSSITAFNETDMANLRYVELEQHSQRDELTGAANRAFMLECIQLVIKATKRHKKKFALLFIDLDQFKPVNDKLGHAMGDSVLKGAARRLISVMRESDTLGRHGGDEFLALLNEISRPEDVEKVTNKIAQVLAKPFYIKGHRIQLAASIGVAIYPQDGLEPEALISCADHAMYRAKRNGGNCCSN